jgi:diadenosine tetraphosphatase ApaH/serine/threonine PP2A family protein phosphatase
LSYGAVHPADYLPYLSASQRNDDDAVVIDALYNASLYVYGSGRHRSVFFTTNDDDDEPGNSILSYIPDATLRHTVRTRLQLYQRAYLDAYRTGTVLGDWLEQRPIAAVIDNTTLFVHGGLAPQAASQYLSTVQKVDELNAMFRRHASEEKLGTFLTGTTTGQLVYHLVTFRGNHKQTNCADLVLPAPLTRLAVGHTPGKMVRDPCGNGQFLALDSSLSRWFRNSGNQYCRGDNIRPSSSGDYVCTRKNDACQGQIVRIRGNQVEILSINAATTAAE